MKQGHTLAALLITAIASPAFASNGTGKVTNIITTSNGIVLFTLQHAGAPACTVMPNDFAMDTTTASGKASYALLLTATSLGRAVTIVGTNTCDVWPDRESVQYAQMAIQ